MPKPSEAWRLGWRVRVRWSVFGPHHKRGWRDHVLCDYSAELDMLTLLWTRGNIPLDNLRLRLRCPKCGNDKIGVYFEIPNNPVAVAARGKLDFEDFRDES